jgi:uncharacterized protein
MPDSVVYGLVGLIVLVTAYQEGITGFGCTVLALPFVTLLLGIEPAVPILRAQALLLAILIVLESRQHIVWREVRHMTILIALGIPFGVWLWHSREPGELKWILAGFMLVVGTHGLIRQMVGKGHSKMSPRKKLLTSAFLPLSGVLQGSFGTGGPLVVIYASRAIADKTVFRVTLCMIWALTNSVLVAGDAASSALSGRTLVIALCCLPLTVLGWFFGNKAHYGIEEGAFRKVVYSVLIIAGAVLVCSSAGLFGKAGG